MSEAGWRPARVRKPSIPLTLLTGALGAGKTTLLNRLLRDPAFADAAVIVNEPGDVALEQAATVETGDGMIALGAGCVCCTMRGELVEALERLLRGLDNGRIARISRVAIEAAARADPSPIFALLTRHPYLSLRFHLDGIVTVVDAGTGLARLAAEDEALHQVAAADRIVLTATEAAPDTDALRARIAELNPGAAILDAERGEATATALTGIADDVLRWLAAGAVAAHPDSRAFLISRDAAFSRAVLEGFLDEAAVRFGPSLVRTKGLVALADSPDRPALVHGLGEVFALPVLLPAWPDADHRTRLVVTGRDLDRRAFETLFDAWAGTLAPDTPDRAAMTDNPLAIAGFRPR
jgi:G3E family GTPase